MKHASKLLAVSLAAAIAVLPACSSKGNNSESSAPASGGASPTSSASASGDQNKDPLGKYDQTVEFTTGMAINNDLIQKLPAGATVDDNASTKFVLDQLNAKTKILWQTPGDGTAYYDKLNVLIGSNDIPDIFTLDAYGGYSIFKTLVKNGMVEDLSQVYQDYALPEIKDYNQSTDNKSLDLATVDGKLYGIPTVNSIADSLNMVWIRKDWLDKVGMQGPKTIDDVAAIAKAFMEKDPGGNGAGKTIGMLMSQDPVNAGNLHSLYPVVSSVMGGPSQMWLKGDDGKVQYSGISEQAKMSLAKVADWYKQGLIDKEFALKDDGKNNELVKDGKVGIMFHAWWGPYMPLADPLRLKPDDANIDWEPFVISDSQGNAPLNVVTPVGTIMVVKKGFAHPELAMKLMNLAQQVKERKYPEMNKLMDASQKDGGYKDFGTPIWPLGFTSTPADEIIRGYKQIKSVADGQPLDSIPADKQTIYKNIKDYEDSVKADPTKRNLDLWPDYRAWAPEGSGAAALANAKIDYIYSAFSGTTKTMESKWSILKDKQKDAYLKIIMGKKDISYFDSFVKDWKASGGDQITQEVNDFVSGNK